jgi:hypothetical protein
MSWEMVVPPPEYSNRSPGSNADRTGGLLAGFFPSRISGTVGIFDFLVYFCFFSDTAL